MGLFCEEALEWMVFWMSWYPLWVVSLNTITFEWSFPANSVASNAFHPALQSPEDRKFPKDVLNTLDHYVCERAPIIPINVKKDLKNAIDQSMIWVSERNSTLFQGPTLEQVWAQKTMESMVGSSGNTMSDVESELKSELEAELELSSKLSGLLSVNFPKDNEIEAERGDWKGEWSLGVTFAGCKYSH
jgi:hypothetical protein